LPYEPPDDPPPTEDDPPPIEDIEDDPPPLAGQEPDIPNSGIPLGGLGVGVAWSLLNLLMSVLAIFNAAVLLILVIIRKRKKDNEITASNGYGDEAELDEADENIVKRRRLVTFKILTLLAGIIPLTLFLILENIRLPLVWITRWTPLIGAFFIIHMIFLLIHFVIKKRISKDKKSDQQWIYDLTTEGAVM